MILLDTNVLSALMLRAPERTVVSWLDRQAPESVWTTAITVFELEFGVALLVSGRRRRELERAFGAVIDGDLGGRVLPFDTAAAKMAGPVAARARAAGRSVEIRDVQIAGIALAHKATLATRNTRHFAATGIDVVDPWRA